jgi:hypothetical protein
VTGPTPACEPTNPRYLAYCRAHGHTWQEQQVLDEENWPGGRAVGFILWISAAWQAFDQAHGISIKQSLDTRRLRRWDVFRPHKIDPQVAFDMWLATYATPVEVP